MTPRTLTHLLLALLIGLALALQSVRTGTAGQLPRSEAVSAEKLARLLTAPVPFRNLFTLANQLKIRPPRSIPHIVRTTSPNYPVGHRDKFEVLSEDVNTYFGVTATIVAKTPHLYFYVATGLKVDADAVRKVADNFEASIYPTDRKHFGSEWTPGIDGDPHITLLYAPLRTAGVLGYFSAEDEYPRAVQPHSNEREMVYMNASTTSPSSTLFRDVLSHEFQHMIHFHMHPLDNAWLNEGMSTVAERLNGYASYVNDMASSFMDLPDTQLNTWSLDGASNSAHYGGAFLYLSYLYDHYGSGIIRDLVSDKRYTDFALVDDVLHRRRIGLTADEVFRNWTVANIVNDRSVAGGKYGYKAFKGTARVQRDLTGPFTYTGSVPPYAAQYLTVASSADTRPLRLQFSGAATLQAVGGAGAGPFWWSNRGDLSDTRLVRTVDLRQVRTAHLTFKAWYQTEKNYDFAYVEASRDGGKTWQTLRTPDTTTANSTGGNYGQAFTGSSKGWRSESVDLTPFAGKVIKIRFEYITDDEYNGQGFVVKDVSVPEIHYRDGFSGWSTQGFVPVTKNALPARWYVSVVLFASNGVTVKSLPVSTSGTGAVTIDPTVAGFKKAIVAVFTTAPKSSATASYTLSATQQ